MINEKLPKLGFGAMRMPTLQDGAIDIPQVTDMIDRYMEAGFNYFDTAYPYHNGLSEATLKECLVDRYPRDSFYLADKLPIWAVSTKDDPERLFDEQLKRCGVEYFDFYLIHAMNADRIKIAENNDVFGFVQKLKQDGRVKHIGFSFHDTAEVLDDILSKHPELEFVQLQLNYLDIKKGKADSWYQVALKYNVPIIAMEPVKGGTLADRLHEDVKQVFTDANTEVSVASWALRYVSGLDGVITTLSGMSNIDQLNDNVRTYKQFAPLSPDEQTVIDKALMEMSKLSVIPCTDCKYCMEQCPQGIEIPVAFAYYNEVKNGGGKFNCGLMYNTIPEGHRAADCIECGNCIPLCPQGIDVVEELKKVRAEFA